MKLQLSEPLGTSPENSLCSSEKKKKRKNVLIIIHNILYFALQAFGFLITFFFKHKIAIPKRKKKKTFLFLSPIPFLRCSFPPLPYRFHPSYLPSVFIQYFSPFLSLPLALILLHPFHMCSIVSFSPHSTSFTSFSLLPSNTCFVSPRSHI
jgi:hypothetical protein